MLIVMDKEATRQQIDTVVAAIEAKGYTARPIPGGERVSIGVLYNKGAVDASLFLGYAGVKDIVPVTRPYKLVSREFQPEDTLVQVGEVTIGNGHFTIIAGPCAIESEEQALTIAEHVKNSGAEFFRGGAFKPRTSPYSFQGLGEEGLKILDFRYLMRDNRSKPTSLPAGRHKASSICRPGFDYLSKCVRTLFAGRGQ